MGKIIVIEGVDAAGKETQSNLLYEYLKSKDEKVMKISFPDYESPSSALVKMYLNGDFGENPNDVSPYAASSFFAVDRYASYKTKWGSFYDEGYTIIADRYVPSNMIYQAGKIDDEAEKEKFLTWVCDYEYNVLSLPKPDVSIFLDVPPKISFELMDKRLNKITGEEKKDIHEKNKEYLIKTYENAKYITEKFQFKIIDCVKDNSLKTIEDIHELIKGVL